MEIVIEKSEVGRNGGRFGACEIHPIMGDSRQITESQIQSDRGGNPRRNITGLHWVLLCLIIAIGGFVRFWDIGGTSLWMDELWSIELSMGHGSAHFNMPLGQIRTEDVRLTDLATAAPISQVWTHQNGSQTHPPIFGMLLRIWMDLFGNSPAAVRTLSAVFSLAIVVVFCDVCRILHGTKAALICAAIMSLAVGQIELAQEARSYSQLIFFMLIAADALVRMDILGVNWRRLFPLALALTATVLTHYLCVGAIAAMGAYAMIRFREQALRRTLGAFVIGGVLALVLWGPQIKGQIASAPAEKQRFLQEAVGAPHLLDSVIRLLTQPTHYLFGQAVTGQDYVLPISRVIVVAIFALVIFVPAVQLLRGNRQLLFWVLWMGGTLGCIICGDLLRNTKMLTVTRYTILASPGIYAVLGAMVWPKWMKSIPVIPIAIIAILGFADFKRAYYGALPIEDYREIAMQVRERIPSYDLMVYHETDPWIGPGLFYMGLRYYSPQFHHPWMVLNANATPPVLDQLKSQDHLWLVTFHPTDKAAEILPGWHADGPPMVNTACAVLRMEPDMPESASNQ